MCGKNGFMSGGSLVLVATFWLVRVWFGKVLEKEECKTVCEEKKYILNIAYLKN